MIPPLIDNWPTDEQDTIAIRELSACINCHKAYKDADRIIVTRIEGNKLIWWHGTYGHTHGTETHCNKRKVRTKKEMYQYRDTLRHRRYRKEKLHDPI